MLLAPKEAEMSALSNFNIYAFWRCKISGKTHEIFDAKNEWGVFTTFVTPPACVDRPPRSLAKGIHTDFIITRTREGAGNAVDFLSAPTRQIF